MRRLSRPRMHAAFVGPRAVCLARLVWQHRATALATLLVAVILVQQGAFRYRLSLLRSAGPVGYTLLNGRRWVMTAAIASGSGRFALVALEGAQHNSHERSNPGSGKGTGGGNGSPPGWGERCWKPGQPHILVAVPYNAAMPEALQQNLAATLSRLE